MRIEAVLKHFSPKSLMITDIPGATASDSLSGTDVMAAIGMCQASARFGMSAYLGKAGISQRDREDAAKALALYAHKTAPKLLSKAAGRKMGQCMIVLAKFAYDDYARSAADTTKCPHCQGRGVTNTLARVMTHPGCGKKTPPTYQLQMVENQCVTCHGKGKLSARCRCGGTGRVRDIERSKLVGAPVEKNCERCGGLGFKRQPSTMAFTAIRHLVPELNERTWRRNWKPFYESLVSKCEIEESRACDEFKKITR
ncbi:molecular chaperone [bacteria symbiont BFo1 of Frankliniella occidentalis]|nr:molecular chaperone [bacteria symbiont BFo1 of Frankliniella occidentalis]KYP85893.1 molecular chaperone [bacteria symbiont BFo1 of Frankliniella occidentalis]